MLLTKIKEHMHYGINPEILFLWCIKALIMVKEIKKHSLSGSEKFFVR